MASWIVYPDVIKPHHVYVNVLYQTLTIEEAFELAREINRVAFNQEQLRSKGYEQATGCCAKCKHPLEAHKETAPGGTPLTLCKVPGCHCES